MEPTNIAPHRRSFLSASGGAATAALGRHLRAAQDPPGAEAKVLARAIVIGINEIIPSYRPLRSLERAVPQAINFAKWLLAAKLVEPRDLTLLLSRVPRLPADLDGVDVRPAESRKVRAAVNDCMSFPPRHHRLFFYAAGHGCRVRDIRSGNGTTDAIFPADYDEGTVKAVDLTWVQEYLEYCPYTDQFLIFDCCRTERPGEVAESGKETTPNAKGLRRGRDWRQWVVCSTRPGELAFDGDGLFSDTLLEYLEGRGSAKQLDPTRRKYRVTWEQVVSALEAHFASHKFLKIDSRVRSSNPDGWPPAVLKELPAGNVASVTVTVRVAPPVAGAAVADLTVSPNGPGEVVTRRLLLDGSPVTFTVPPQGYTLRVEAPEYVTVREPHEWFADTSLTVRLRAGAAGPPNAGMTSDLVVEADDLATWIEVENVRSGRLVPDVTGRTTVLESFQARNLPPGVYRTSWGVAGRPPVGRLVEVAPGRTTVVCSTPDGPPPDPLPPGQFGASGRYAALLAARARPAERFLAGRGAASDLLALWAQLAHHVGRLGPDPTTMLEPFADGSGIRVVLGSDPGTDVLVRDLLGEVVVGYRPLTAPGEWRPLHRRAGGPGDPPGLLAASEGVRPGSYLVRMGGDRQRVELVVNVLKGREAVLVAVPNELGMLSVRQFMPPAAPDGRPNPDLAGRRELLQRDLEPGPEPDRGKRAAVLVAQLRGAGDAEFDPVSGGLELLTLAAQHDYAGLRERATALRDRFDGLPDAWVALALARDVLGPDGAAEYRNALDRGLPTLAAFTTELMVGVEKHAIDHPTVPALRAVYATPKPWPLWSGFTERLPRRRRKTP